MHNRLWALALLAVSPVVLAGTPLPDGPHIVVRGEGTVSAVPDSAEVTMTVQHVAATPAEAKRVVDEAVNALIAAAPGFDVAPGDITASDLHLQRKAEEDDQGRPLPVGYSAYRRVKVTLGDIQRLGEYTDATLALGFTGIGNIDFQSTREDALREEARAKAVAQAREQAAGLIAKFGGTLGPVYSINSVDSSLAQGYGAQTLDRIQVTGSRVDLAQYLRPNIEFVEEVSAVFEINR